MTFKQVLTMAGRSVSQPREGAAEVMALGVTRQAVWMAMSLTVILTILIVQIPVALSGLPPGSVPLGPVILSPWGGFLFYWGFTVLSALAAYLVGRAMGGQGQFPEALLLFTWLQFIMVLVQVVQIAAMLILPPLAGIIAIAGVVLFLWLLTNFVAELHGFRSLGQVFLMILVTAFGLAFIAAPVMMMLGLDLQGQPGAI